jgi:GNAT superfamily N-acetyltransferase
MYRIREASLAEVEFLADVTLTATRAQGRLAPDFDEPAWREGFTDWTRESIDDPATVLYVVEVDDRPAGRLRVSRTPEAVELNGIQLHPDVQNRGIGTAIVNALQSEATRRGVPLQLTVERDNPDARRLYDRLGFSKTGEAGAEDILQWTKGVEQNRLWNADVATRYDTPGTGMFAADVLRPTVERLTELAAGGRALEFAIGTGRVAVPPPPTRRPRNGRRRRPRLHPAGHVRRTPAAHRLAPLPFHGRHRRAAGSHAAALHLARRTGPDGPARGFHPRVPPRRLVRHTVHRRLAVARIGLPPAFRVAGLRFRDGTVGHWSRVVRRPTMRG